MPYQCDGIHRFWKKLGKFGFKTPSAADSNSTWCWPWGPGMPSWCCTDLSEPSPASFMTSPLCYHGFLDDFGFKLFFNEHFISCWFSFAYSRKRAICKDPYGRTWYAISRARLNWCHTCGVVLAQVFLPRLNLEWRWFDCLKTRCFHEKSLCLVRINPASDTYFLGGLS